MNDHGLNSHRLEMIAKRLGFSYEIIEHNRIGKTFQEAADAIGIDKNFIIKALLLCGSGKNIGAILRGSDMLDIKRLEKVSGVRNLRLAPVEKVKEVLDFEVGEIPPLAFKDKGIRTFVDTGVVSMPFVVGSGGTHYTGMKFDPHLLDSKLKYVVSPIAKRKLQKI